MRSLTKFKVKFTQFLGVLGFWGFGVLGGLIIDNESSGKTGVPLLMDIPLLGNLFSTTADSSKRTELLIFITPRVVESSDQLRLLSDEMRGRMRGLKNFDDLPASVEAP